MSEGPPASGDASFNLQKWINSGQLILSLVTAIGAFYISIEQHRLAEAQAELTLQVDTQAKTTRYAEELTKYIDNVSQQEDKDRLNALRIDLADAVTAAASSESGELGNNRLTRMPMWLALATGNDDGLRLIAGDANGRKVWLPLAQTSTDKKVRETAIEVIRTSADLPPAEILKLIFELSDELDNPEVEAKALDAMQQVIARMKRRGDPALERGDLALQPILTRISSMRASLRGQVAVAVLEPEERNTLQARERLFNAALEAFGVQETVATVGRGPAPNPSTTPAVGAQQLAQNQQALEALDSDNSETRRTARATLASQLDPTSAAALLENLQNDSASYREKLGALVALRDSSRNVQLSEADVAAIVALIGDDDATMRMNASELLMKITDARAVRAATAQLTEIVGNRGNANARPNQVYNAVAVLGTWSRVLPDSLSEDRAGIDRFLRTERSKMSADNSWGRTAKLIDDLLALKETQ